MNEIEKAWIAGIIDGEGCIFIKKRVRSDGKCKFHGYQMGITVGNTDRRMIDRLKFLTGFGSIHEVIEKRESRNRKSYIWITGAKNGFIFLSKIKDYLICKKEQAEIALQIQSLISNSRNYVKEEIKNLQDDLYLKMKELNRRGPLYLHIRDLLSI